MVEQLGCVDAMARHPPPHRPPAASAAVHARHARPPQPRPCYERGKGRREAPPPHVVPCVAVAGKGAMRAERRRPPAAPRRAELKAAGGMEGGRQHRAAHRARRALPATPTMRTATTAARRASAMAAARAHCIRGPARSDVPAAAMPRALTCHGERGKERGKGGAGGRPRHQVRSRGTVARAEAEHGGGVQSVVAVALPSPALTLRRLRPDAAEEEDGQRERAAGEDERGEETCRRGGGRSARESR
ncbi:armadillo repeat-containing X-linked protein 2-like [Panicum virgatum]|uniref:armadillo repeat-containing X-linked protein 2-like n=1 Tax=Panicum virgatum TaxID=38727 RepID=UPI0019D5CB94|nr:armadillo repeat-containing X-linked protein 2-like [Panicum virgatum]